jgi:hypothetical protein
MDMLSVDEAGDHQGRGKRRTVRCRSSAGSPAMKDSENNWPLDLLACLAPTRELGLEKVEGDHITTPSIRFRTALRCE